LSVALLANTITAYAACGGTPTVVTDKEDYGSLETVQISGSGFDCGTALYVKVIAPDGTTRSGDGSGANGPDVVTSDSNGEFTLNYSLHGTLADGSTYSGQEGAYTLEVLAGDGSVLATTTFRDSHMRAGIISWTREPGTRNVHFTVQVAFRNGLPINSVTMNFGDGTSGSTNTFIASGGGTDSSGPASAYSIRRFTFPRKTYNSGDGPYTASVTICCRIAGLVNTRETSFRISSVVDLANNNPGSPTISNAAIVQMVQGHFNRIRLTVTEDAGDTPTCRLATFAESQIENVAQTPSHILSVTSDCFLEWDTSQTALGQRYAVQVIVEGNRQGRLSSTSSDFIIEIVDGSPPTCTPDGNTHTVQPGQNFSTSIVGTDPDNQQLTISHQGLPTGATLSPSAGTSGPSPLTGTFMWTPTSANAGSNTAVTIVFADTDNLQVQCGFTILVPVNQSPIATDDSFVIAEDTTLTGNLLHDNGFGVDSDPEGDPLTVSTTPVTNPSSGSLTLNTDGTFSYTPLPDFYGTDTFTYRILDGNSFSPPATVTIEVTPVDDAPIAVDDTGTVAEDGDAITIDVLANDSDSDGGMSIVAVTQPANGTMVVAGDSLSVSYEPNVNFCNTQDSGTPDTFTYTLNGGSQATVAVTVTCVDDAPLAVNDTATVEEDAAATTIDVLSNDTNDDGGPKIIVDVDPPANGAVVITNGGADLTYQPNADYCNDGSPTDDFTYTLNGGSQATVVVTVTCMNHAPTANAGTSYSGNEGAGIALSNATASDADGDTLTYMWSVDSSLCSFSGETELNPTLTCHDNSASTPFQVTLTVNDGTESSTSTADVTVANIAPAATLGAPASVDEGGSINLSLIAPSDPSTVDSTAGFQYAFDCGDGAGYSASASNTATCSTSDNGTRTVKGKISDKDGSETEYTAEVPVNNVAPTAILDNDGPVNEGGLATISFSAAVDPSSVDTTAGFHYVFACDNGDLGAATYATASSDATTQCTFVDNGDYSVKGRIIDKNDSFTEFTTSVSVVNLAPSVAADNESVTVDEGQVANNSGMFSEPGTDTVSLSASVGTITDNGDGTWSWSFNTTDGPAQTGTIIITAQDEDGGSSTVSFALTVNNVAPALGATSVDQALVPVNTAFNASASVTDPGTLDTHTAAWDWGNGTSTGTITQGAGSASVKDSHSYSLPGVYTIKLTVADKDGAPSDESVYQYVVVYDPSAGFVTGGGWIESPAGAYTPADLTDENYTGKANFGFVSKYQKGAKLPTGETQFQFKAGNLNFHSTSYDWLVVAGANAKYKGLGTINGAGSYRFMLTATDGQISGDGGVDKFRIKIWEENADGSLKTVIYDNQPEESDDSYAGTALGGGSIVVHSGKDAKVGKASISDAEMAEEVDEGTQRTSFFLPYIEN
jgi:VCBS repeat-containing protein